MNDKTQLSKLLFLSANLMYLDRLSLAWYIYKTRFIKVVLSVTFMSLLNLYNEGDWQ